MKLETYKKYYRGKALYGCDVAFTEEQGLVKVHEVCGCAGKFDCDCISVVNQVQSELWYNYNSNKSQA